jgi:hypothetical protein
MGPGRYPTYKPLYLGLNGIVIPFKCRIVFGWSGDSHSFVRKLRAQKLKIKIKL